MDEDLNFELDLDFLSEPPAATAVAMPVPPPVSQQSQSLPTSDPYDVSQLASRIANVNDLVEQLLMQQTTNDQLQKQLFEFNQSANNVKSMYEVEKAKATKLAACNDRLKVELNAANNGLVNKTLEYDQLKAQYALKDIYPLPYDGLCISYLKLVKQLERSGNRLCIQEKDNIAQIRSFLTGIYNDLEKCNVKKRQILRYKLLESNFINVSASQKDGEVQCEIITRKPAAESSTQSCQTEMAATKTTTTHTQGTQYISSTTTRGTCTSAFIKKHSVGTNFPEVVPMSVDDILKEMIFDLSPISAIADLDLPPQTPPPPPRIQTRSTSTCTDLKNVRMQIDYVPVVVKKSDSRPPSRIMLEQIKKESSMVSGSGNNAMNVVNQFGNAETSDLWNLLGQTIFALIRNGSSQINETQLNLLNERMDILNRKLQREEEERRQDDSHQQAHVEKDFYEANILSENVNTNEHPDVNMQSAPLQRTLSTTPNSPQLILNNIFSNIVSNNLVNRSNTIATASDSSIKTQPGDCSDLIAAENDEFRLSFSNSESNGSDFPNILYGNDELTFSSCTNQDGHIDKASSTIDMIDQENISPTYNGDGVIRVNPVYIVETSSQQTVPTEYDQFAISNKFEESSMDIDIGKEDEVNTIEELTAVDEILKLFSPPSLSPEMSTCPNAKTNPAPVFTSNVDNIADIKAAKKITDPNSEKDLVNYSCSALKTSCIVKTNPKSNQLTHILNTESNLNSCKSFITKESNYQQVVDGAKKSIKHNKRSFSALVTDLDSTPPTSMLKIRSCKRMRVEETTLKPTEKQINNTVESDSLLSENQFKTAMSAKSVCRPSDMDKTRIGDNINSICNGSMGNIGDIAKSPKRILTSQTYFEKKSTNSRKQQKSTPSISNKTKSKIAELFDLDSDSDISDSSLGSINSRDSITDKQFINSPKVDLSKVDLFLSSSDESPLRKSTSSLDNSLNGDNSDDDSVDEDADANQAGLQALLKNIINDVSPAIRPVSVLNDICISGSRRNDEKVSNCVQEDNIKLDASIICKNDTDLDDSDECMSVNSPLLVIDDPDEHLETEVISNGRNPPISISELSCTDENYYSPMSPAHESTTECQANPVVIPTVATRRPRRLLKINSIIGRIMRNYCEKIRGNVLKNSSGNLLKGPSLGDITKLSSILQCYINGPDDVYKCIQSTIANSSHPRIIAKTVVSIVECLQTAELIAPEMPIQIQKIIVYISKLKMLLPSISKIVVQLIEDKLFTFKPDVIEMQALTNLTNLYIGVNGDSNADHNPARLFICNCLYFYNLKAIPMIFQILMAYPAVLPIKDDPSYDRSDAIINTIQCILMNTFYQLANTEMKNKQLFTLLRNHYKYDSGKPTKNDLINNLFAKIRAGNLKNVSYGFSLICKRHDQSWAERNVIRPMLMPLANEYYSTVEKTEENDLKIACLLETISFIIKPFTLQTDVTVYLNIFERFLNVAQNRKSIQEAAVCAIIRSARFGYVDIDEETLQRYIPRATPLLSDYLVQRSHPFRIDIYKGSIGSPDECLRNTDAVIGIEIIEHLFPETLEDVPYNIFGFIQPKIVIFSTPNSDFNVLFNMDQPNGFRHYDHKFEWSRQQFKDWCLNICERFPYYQVSILGVGAPPPEHAKLGHVSQMAVFVRTDILNLQQIGNVSNNGNRIVQNQYALLHSEEYPYTEDNRSLSQKILDESLYHIRRLRLIGRFYNPDKYIFQIPIKAIFEFVGHLSGTMEKMTDVLAANSYQIENDFLILQANEVDYAETSDSDECNDNTGSLAGSMNEMKIDEEEESWD